MNFITPKNKRTKRVDWLISERTRTIVECYAEYTEYTEDEVVDEFLKNILKDEQFLTWIKNKRYNKRILNRMFTEEQLRALEETDIG